MDKIAFSQIMDHTSRYQFDCFIMKYNENKKFHGFSCWDHFLCMSFTQLTYRNSLHDTEIGLTFNQNSYYLINWNCRESNTNEHFECE